MNKVKQETFSNFHYEMIKSIDNRCADVKCTYSYKGKTLTHYFSYAKSGKKPDSYYISKAKADMDKIVKEKSPETVANKDLNAKKATFFKRHKKPILATTVAVLVAGVAAAATLVTLKLTAKPADPTAVTEEEIDKYLEGPEGDSKQVSPMWAAKIIDSALKNYEEYGLKQVETKMISSVPIYTLLDNLVKESNSASDIFSLLPDYNDTSKFYSDKNLQSTSYYGSYLKGRILKDKKESKASTIYTRDNYEELKNGVNSSSKIELDYTLKHTANPDTTQDDYLIFGDARYKYEGFGGANLESTVTMGNVESPEKAGSTIAEETITNSRELTMFTESMAQTMMDKYIQQFRVSEKDSTVFLKVDFTDLITGDAPVELIMGIPVNYRVQAIWCFKNISEEDGWVLESFACDGYYALIYGAMMSQLDSIGLTKEAAALSRLVPKYVEYNQKGEKLKDPLCINKGKMFTKIEYGDLDEDKAIDEITYNPDKKIYSPFDDDDVAALYMTEEGYQEPTYTKDYSLYRRIENPEFNGYSHVGRIAPLNTDADIYQCEEGSHIIFKTEDASGNKTFYGYNQLKDYLDSSIFEKGQEVEEGIFTIKLKKAGWMNFEMVFDTKLKLTNFVMDFHEGASPVTPKDK